MHDQSRSALETARLLRNMQNSPTNSNNAPPDFEGRKCKKVIDLYYGPLWEDSASIWAEVGAVKVRQLIGEKHMAQSDWARMYKINPCKALPTLLPAPCQRTVVGGCSGDVGSEGWRCKIWSMQLIDGICCIKNAGRTYVFPEISRYPNSEWQHFNFSKGLYASYQFSFL